MPNFQAPIRQLTTTVMGAAIAIPMAKERYTNKQINKATNYAQGLEKKDLIKEEQAIAANEEIDRIGKYVPEAYKHQFESALKDIRPVSLEEKLKCARSERQAEEEAKMYSKANSIQNRQSAINKSKATKLLPRDVLNMIQEEYVKYTKSLEHIKEDKDGKESTDVTR